MINYVLAYDYAALALILVISIYFLSRRTIKTTANYVFGFFLLDGFLTTTFDIGRHWVFYYYHNTNSSFVYAMEIMYLILVNGLPMIMYMYTIFASKDSDKYSLKNILHVIIPFSFEFLLIVTTGLTGWVTKLTPTGLENGIGMYFVYSLNWIYFFFAFHRVFKYHKQLGYKHTITITVSIVLMISAIIVQAVVAEEIILTNLAAAFAFTITMMSLENPDVYKSQVYDCWNKKAFETAIEREIGVKHHFAVYGFKISNIEAITSVIGSEECTRVINSFMHRMSRKNILAQMFHLGNNHFAYVVPYREKNGIDLFQYADYLHFESLSERDLSINLELDICALKFPETAISYDEIYDGIIMTLANFKKDNQIFKRVDTSIIKQKHREEKIVSIIRQSLKNDSIDVYFQPIYSTKEKAFNSGEALVRLISSDLSFISPEEFIPLAEKNGLILQIGESVFRKVCRIIKEDKLIEKGIQYIAINLSAVQCMQENLHKNMLEIMNEFGIDPEMICFEISESFTSNLTQTLAVNMDEMLKHKVKFSLDDFGNEFLNVNTLVQYPFDSVKFDKSIIFKALNDENSMFMLKHTVKMLKDMNIIIIAKGVENEEMEKLLIEMEVDYLQGYLYSKPINKEAFLEFISK